MSISSNHRKNVLKYGINIGEIKKVYIAGEIMSENIGLFYFSGTGNTRSVTRMIKESFQNRGIGVESFSIDELISKKINIEVDKYSMIGMGYPIHGFGAPRIVETFLSLMPSGNNKDVFIYTTAADFVAVNYNASAKVAKEFKIKGYNVFYERIICMGSNFLIKYDKELEHQLYLAAYEKAGALCTDVLARKRRKNRLNLIFGGVVSLIHWFEDKFAPLVGSSLHTTEKCNLCGLCVRNCPTNNIYVKDNKISFKRECFLCMRCIYACPQKAITAKSFNFFILKDGYNINDIINKEYLDISGEDKTKKAAFFKKHFADYLSDISK